MVGRVGCKRNERAPLVQVRQQLEELGGPSREGYQKQDVFLVKREPMPLQKTRILY